MNGQKTSAPMGALAKQGGGINDKMPPQIAIQLENLNTNSDFLAELLTLLEQKLMPILTDSRPSDIKEKSEEEQLVPIARLLRTANVKMKDKINFVQELLSRIEI